jgi:hypothetical protein
MLGLVIVFSPVPHGGGFEIFATGFEKLAGDVSHRPVSRRCGDSLPNQGDEFVHLSLVFAIAFATAGANVRVAFVTFPGCAVVATSSHFVLLLGRLVDDLKSFLQCANPGKFVGLGFVVPHRPIHLFESFAIRREKLHEFAAACAAIHLAGGHHCDVVLAEIREKFREVGVKAFKSPREFCSDRHFVFLQFGILFGRFRGFFS